MNQRVLEISGYIFLLISIAAFIALGSFVDSPLDWLYLKVLGGILLGTGVLFVGISTFTLIRNQGAGLIDWGIYGIVRHPMYVGAMILFASWVFFLPHWLTLILSLLDIVIVYLYVLQGDQRNMELFGNEYRDYMLKVPQVNFVNGMVNHYIWKAKKQA
jgi:protein-S-isoprenylcysteine O-methyltransferase Ste14